MIKRLTVMTGLAFVLLPAVSLAATPLYDRMKQAVEKEETVNTGADTGLMEYIALVMSTEEVRLNGSQIRDMLGNDAQGMCSKHTKGNIVSCTEMIARIQEILRYEQRIRSLGKTLQADATGYELPISDLPGRALKLSADLRGILNIWSAGTGSVNLTADAPLIRTKAAETDTFQAHLTTLGSALQGLDEEQRTAAVWRYQYGVRLLLNQRAPRFPAPHIDGASGPGTERQYMVRRWEEVEEALLAVWNEIKDDTFDPPLSQNETVYFTFSQELLDNSLPDNMLIWARIDGDANGDFPFGDVGLQWQVPLEPVTPSLIYRQDDGDTPIFGGDYPPEPATVRGSEIIEHDGEGLCTSPTALRGYLCRPFETLIDGERCPAENLDPDEIHLIYCTDDKNERHTMAGPDVCREIIWKDGGISGDPATTCTVAPACGAVEPGGSRKGGDGTIPVRVGNTGPATYSVVRSLVHAYQRCAMPVGWHPYNGLDRERKTAACCKVEGEAFQAQCDMMDRDGVFEGSDFNAESCAEILTNDACGEENEMDGCYTSRTYPDGAKDALLDAMNNNPREVPAACAEALDQDSMDPRIRDFILAINQRDDACTPGKVSQFKNRIGNNMCYVGQCVEMSVELHRIMGGRTPVTVQDEFAPWDSPQTGTPLGNVLMNPPVTQTRLPSYRPQMLMRELEIAFCQLQGLPALTPPILCAISPARQLEATRTIGADATQGLTAQRTEQELSTQDLMDLSPAVAARIGTTLYASYLRESNRSFAAILEMANDLLGDMKKISFPTEMCPIGEGVPMPAQ